MVDSPLVGWLPEVIRHKCDTFEQMESSMTAVDNAAPSATRGSGKLDHFSAHGVHLHAQTYGGTTIIGATGELDAFNIHHLSGFARRCAGARRPLVLDLSRLDFLAAQGIDCLRGVADECERNSIEWALVPGHAVLRLLRICEQDTRLPVMSSIDEALQRFSDSVRPQALLQLVTKSG
jgi:anti-anti-sigma factor